MIWSSFVSYQNAARGIAMSSAMPTSAAEPMNQMARRSAFQMRHAFIKASSQRTAIRLAASTSSHEIAGGHIDRSFAVSGGSQGYRAAPALGKVVKIESQQRVSPGQGGDGFRGRR